MATVVVIGGTAGTGKSTIGVAVAKFFGCSFIEGDELHPQENIDKMSRGDPLTDDDRWGWLAEVSKKSTQSALKDKKKISVVSCSALKKVYRDLIQSTSPDTQFVYLFLHASMAELVRRTNARPGHFMKSNMLQSQLATLELPHDEPGALSIDVEGKSVDDITAIGVEFIQSLKH